MAEREEGWAVRLATADDLSFLKAMLYEAAFWRADQPRPKIEDALRDPRLARYLDGWPRAGDTAVIALDGGNHSVGAAWYRRFDAEAPGYGFVDAATPELSIGVRAEYRGRGAGSALLDALLAAARAGGYAALSLSVEPDNPARRLYERFGFTQVGVNGGAWTMRVRLR